MIRINPLPPYLFHRISELQSVVLCFVYRTVHGRTVRQDVYDTGTVPNISSISGNTSSGTVPLLWLCIQGEDKPLQSADSFTSDCNTCLRRLLSVKIKSTVRIYCAWYKFNGLNMEVANRATNLRCWLSFILEQRGDKWAYLKYWNKLLLWEQPVTCKCNIPRRHGVGGV